MAFNNLCACSPEGFLLAKETTTYTMAAAQWSRRRMEGPQGFKPAGAWPRHRPERTCKDDPTNMNGVQGWSRCRRSLLPLTGVEEARQHGGKGPAETSPAAAPSRTVAGVVNVGSGRPGLL